MEFIQIPREFNDIKDLNFTEKGLLAIYKYWSEKGHSGYCTMKNEELYKEWLNVSQCTFKRMKKKLKDLGYITVVGIKVKYVGNVKSGIDLIPSRSKNDTNSGIDLIPYRYKFDTKSGIDLIPQKEEKNKKEKKEGLKTNFDRIIGGLSEYYKTQDKIEFIESIHSDFIDKINKLDYEEINVSLCHTQIKNMIIGKFGSEEYNEVKEEKKKDSFYSVI